MKLSDNLTLDEFTRSSTATARKIDNSLPPVLLPHAQEYAVKCFQKVRSIWGNAPRTLNSGYRCKALNTAVGGSLSSQHMSANAADYTIRPGENIFEMFLKLVESNLNFDQLLIEGMDATNPSKGWIHVSYNTLRIRGDINSGFNPSATQRRDIKTVFFDTKGNAITNLIDREGAIAWAKEHING